MFATLMSPGKLFASVKLNTSMQISRKEGGSENQPYTLNPWDRPTGRIEHVVSPRATPKYCSHFVAVFVIQLYIYIQPLI